MRSMVEGKCGLAMHAGLVEPFSPPQAPYFPSTTLRVVPLPICDGEDFPAAFEIRVAPPFQGGENSSVALDSSALTLTVPASGNDAHSAGSISKIGIATP